MLSLLQARELSELLDFAEQERLTLLEKEQALQQEINQARCSCSASQQGRLRPCSGGVVSATKWHGLGSKLLS